MPDSALPRKEAVAIRYDARDDDAPRVVAKGTGDIADRILAAAKQHTVPVFHNRTLTAMLMAVELDREIPPALYKVVAEVLAHVYRLDQSRGKR
jgi:Uncharacterized homolog of the cytoplasmic domain of flagellar protein FhlB